MLAQAESVTKLRSHGTPTQGPCVSITIKEWLQGRPQRPITRSWLYHLLLCDLGQVTPLL